MQLKCCFRSKQHCIEVCNRNGILMFLSYQCLGSGIPVALSSWEASDKKELDWYRKQFGCCLPPLSAQYFESDPKFVLLTQRSLVEIEVHWPASHIFRGLEMGQHDDLAAFSYSNGGTETAAICAHIGTAGKSNKAKVTPSMVFVHLFNCDCGFHLYRFSNSAGWSLFSYLCAIHVFLRH